MRTAFLLPLLLAATLVQAQDAPTPTPKPSPGEDSALSRSKALDLAGAFANDGYKVRDGFWSGTLEKGKPQFLEVNLFAGNEYWFSAAAAGAARKITVSVFDTNGQPIDSETYEDGPSAAAGLIPETSGPRILRVLLTEGEKADFTLVYSYK